MEMEKGEKDRDRISTYLLREEQGACSTNSAGKTLSRATTPTVPDGKDVLIPVCMCVYGNQSVVHPHPSYRGIS